MINPRIMPRHTDMVIFACSLSTKNGQNKMMEYIFIKSKRIQNFEVLVVFDSHSDTPLAILDYTVPIKEPYIPVSAGQGNNGVEPVNRIA